MKQKRYQTMNNTTSNLLFNDASLSSSIPAINQASSNEPEDKNQSEKGGSSSTLNKANTVANSKIKKTETPVSLSSSSSLLSSAVTTSKPQSIAISVPKSPEVMFEEGLKQYPPPGHFLCPISKKLMVNPVVAEDYYTYDRDSFKGPRMSPKQSTVQIGISITYSLSLKIAIDRYVETLKSGKAWAIDSNNNEWLCCPISQEIMLDPVIVSDGYTYERKNIKKWFSENHDSSPMTKKKSHIIDQNNTLKIAAREYLDNHPKEAPQDEEESKQRAASSQNPAQLPVRPAYPQIILPDLRPIEEPVIRAATAGDGYQYSDYTIEGAYERGWRGDRGIGS